MRVSVRRLLRPLLWLPVIVFLVPLAMLVITPVLLFAWLLGLVPMFSSRAFRQDIGITRAGYVAWGVLVPVLVISLSAPFLALLVGAIVYLLGAMSPELLELPWQIYRKLPADFRQSVPPPELSLHFWGWFCLIVGAIGVSSNIVYAALDIPWRLQQIRQIRALPRSRARSAAMGLAEFEGVARLLPVREPKPGEMGPFLLEDETGHILVDPRGVPLRPRAQTAMTLHLNEVEEGISEGDRVYVIGNVQRRDPGSSDDPGTDRLVVRPLRQALVSSPLARLLFAPGKQAVDRHAPNIFIVEKGSEHDVTLRFRLALWEFFVIFSACLAASLWLVYMAWQWL